MTTSKRDYYDILSVAKGASDEDIKKAFRKLAMEFHPDRNRREGAEAKFKEINEAYQVLSDTEKRGAYDRFGHAGVTGNGNGKGFEGYENFGGFGDIFEAFFGGFGGNTRSRPNAARRGSDLQYSMSLDFEQAVFGVDHDVELQRTETCSSCHGTKSKDGATPANCSNCEGLGEVRRAHQSVFGQFVQVVPCNVCSGKGAIITDPCTQCRGSGREQRVRKLEVSIPGGIEEGTQVRLRGEGEQGLNGGPPGDLYVVVRIKPHKIFRREGNDIVYTLPLNISQAALGANVMIPTLKGEAEMEIPGGTQSGQSFRLKGKGVPYLRSKRRGDQIVNVFVNTPMQLTKEQQDLFQQLAESFGDGTKADHPPDKGIFTKIKDTFVNE
jgi:molecular chaperone DnaJ